jgi:hypothetical protein
MNPPRHLRARTASRGWLLLTLAAMTLISPLLLAGSGPARALVTGCVLLLSPGAAVVSCRRIWRVRDPLDELVLIVAVSLSVDILASVAVLTLLHWTFEALFVVLALTAAPLIGWHAIRELAAGGGDDAAA